MILVVKKGLKKEDIEDVIKKIVDLGGRPHLVQGQEALGRKVQTEVISKTRVA